MNDESSQNLTSRLFERFGPTLGGRDLYVALGYKTYSAFYRAKQRDELGVRVFSLPGRRGWFALTETVARWLEQHADKEPATSCACGQLPKASPQE